MSVMAGGGSSRVRIAVDDTSAGQLHVLVDDDLLMVPLRAVRSLSRLDSVLKADERACETHCVTQLAYKCPSLPRGVDRCASVDELRLTLIDADSMSARLSNATLSQDLDGELLALSFTNLCVPGGDRSSSRRHNEAVTLTRSVSARTVTLAPATVNNLLSPPVAGGGLAAVTSSTSSPRWRGLTRSTSCPSMSSSSLHLSSALLQRPPAATTTRAGKGRAQFDGDVDLARERVTDLPVIATTDFPDFVCDEQPAAAPAPAAAASVELTVSQVRRYDANMRLLAQLGRSTCRQRAPQLVQIKCLRWLSSLDHGAV